MRSCIHQRSCFCTECRRHLENSDPQSWPDEAGWTSCDGGFGAAIATGLGCDKGCDGSIAAWLYLQFSPRGHLPLRKSLHTAESLNLMSKGSLIVSSLVRAWMSQLRSLQFSGISSLRPRLLILSCSSELSE